MTSVWKNKLTILSLLAWQKRPLSSSKRQQVRPPSHHFSWLDFPKDRTVSSPRFHCWAVALRKYSQLSFCKTLKSLVTVTQTAARMQMLQMWLPMPSPLWDFRMGENSITSLAFWVRNFLIKKEKKKPNSLFLYTPGAQLILCSRSVPGGPNPVIFSGKWPWAPRVCVLSLSWGGFQQVPGPQLLSSQRCCEPVTWKLGFSLLCCLFTFHEPHRNLVGQSKGSHFLSGEEFKRILPETRTISCLLQPLWFQINRGQIEMHWKFNWL